jgi:hypothetical protein
MGLLDDAIREHLELKRRHGAAEEEVRQQEQEALGPPRRGDVPEPLAPAPAGAEPGPDDEPAVEDAAQAPEFEPAEPLPPEPAGEPDPPADRPAAYAAPREPSVYEDEPWLEESRPAPEPEPEEDVLEETPEFLQETPEHDRLWFEQKPPKDFDFDK